MSKDGDLWVGTDLGGAQRIARDGLVSFSRADGLITSWITSIFETRSGNLYTTSGRSYINHFDGRTFTSVQPNLPSQIIRLSEGYPRPAFQDRMGEWWIPTGVGRYRFPRVEKVEDLARARPKAIYTTRDGLADNNVFRVFEDSRGDLWINSHYPKGNGLTRWDRATKTFHTYSMSAAAATTKRA